ncbi:17S U2 SnRNP complex component HTATSF1-like [Glandiceps talaboti]
MDDFEEQLKQQQLAEEKRKLAEEGLSDPYTYTDPNDGTIYEWDTAKKAWFPKIDDDFIAKYQASYGVQSDDTGTKETVPKSSSKQPIPATSSSGASATDNHQQRQQKEDEEKTSKGQKRKGDEGWFELEDSKNRNVYVSGLPEDVTPDEFLEMMSKCGIVMMDEETEEPKLKLYTDHQGNRKGDGRCCYLKRESVDLALQILDGSELRGHKVHVELAKFTPKGSYNPAMKKKKKKKKQKNQQEKLLEWRPEKNKMVKDARKRHETVVILKNMFDPKEFEEDPMAINEIIDDLKAECGKFGEVKKVMIFDRHPDGVASVKFKEAEEADVCIGALNGRWFAQKRILAVRWDGTTDYQIEETQKERDQRLQQWESFLDKGEGDKKSEVSEKKENSEQAGGPSSTTSQVESSS